MLKSEWSRGDAERAEGSLKRLHKVPMSTKGDLKKDLQEATEGTEIFFWGGLPEFRNYLAQSRREKLKGEDCTDKQLENKPNYGLTPSRHRPDTVHTDFPPSGRSQCVARISV
jgi:hypothetical protein